MCIYIYNQVSCRQGQRASQQKHCETMGMCGLNDGLGTTGHLLIRKMCSLCPAVFTCYNNRYVKSELRVHRALEGSMIPPTVYSHKGDIGIYELFVLTAFPSWPPSYLRLDHTCLSPYEQEQPVGRDVTSPHTETWCLLDCLLPLFSVLRQLYSALSS